MSDMPDGLVAALASRYALEREIGAGGMATVYLARDLRHKRSVAGKGVCPQLGGAEGVEGLFLGIEPAAPGQKPHNLPGFGFGAAAAAGGGSTPAFLLSVFA